MFSILLYNLRRQGILVSTSEWLTFLRGIDKGLVSTLDQLYGFARTVLCTSQTQFDAYDLAFVASFQGVELPPNISSQLDEWLRQVLERDGELVAPNIPIEDLWEELRKRLEEQKEKHDGGSRWVGTGGTSPFGHSGRASHGIRVGGESKNRSAISVAGDRQWATYRSDKTLDIRDMQLVLKELRQLTPVGEMELHVEKTIRKTVDNGGEIDLEFQREKINRIHVVLLLDSGGSMEPFANLVQQFFTAVEESKGFKSFQAWHFHNVPYGSFFSYDDGYQQQHIHNLLREWTPHHRVFWVGDACMAPYELLNPTNYSGTRGIDWIQRIQEHCPKSAWLNPEHAQYWNHPTIEAVRQVVPMFPLTLQGLRDAVRNIV